MAEHYVLQGDCREVLRQAPDDSIQCCVTSPPYWGLRDYGCADQIGLEPTPEEYVASLVEVFREVRRALRPDGTLWLNLGDSYVRTNNVPQTKNAPVEYPRHTKAGSSDGAVGRGERPGSRAVAEGLKPKDLVGIPWRVALALQADGWYLRSDIIWSKPNPMPESVTDRPTRSHEYVFLLSKGPRYYYGHEAVKEPAVSEHPSGNGFARPQQISRGGRGKAEQWTPTATRNRRTVWHIATRPFKGAHFATFPTALVEPCILAGSRTGDLVLDPFHGSGTTGVVAQEHGRAYVGIELSGEYIASAQRPLNGTRVAK